MERIESNTLSLQKHFQKEYSDFFSRNDLVLSGCFNFPWGYHLSGNDLMIKTTLPLKCYIGLKIRNDANIIFNDINFYNIVTRNFEKVNYGKVNGDYSKITELIKDELLNLGVNLGIDIEILSETTRGHSFGFSGTCSSIISYGIYELIKFKNKQLSNIDFNKNIFLLSSKLEYILRYGATHGHSSMFTLKPNKGVSFFLGESKCNYDELEKFSYLFEKINKGNDINLPLDYYIFYSGLSTDSKNVEYLKNIEINDDYISNFLENIDTNNYFKKYKNKEKVIQSKLDILEIENIKTLNYFVDIYKKPYDSNLINNFIEHINNYRHYVGLLEKQNTFAEDLYYIFRNNILNSNEKIGICPAYSGKLGGGYIVITKQGLSRDTVNNTLNDLKKIYPNVEMEYCSYIDGTCEDPIQVEQFISDGIYSKYLDKNKVVYKDNKGNNYLGDYSEIITRETSGLLFDRLSNKIYLNGIKLTSKDIHSQNTTIEIVSKLLDNIGEEISNKELPFSSYSSNKNDMLGKIILPFIKIIEEKTGEKIPLVCKGSITDFYLKIGNVDLKIGIVNKI